MVCASQNVGFVRVKPPLMGGNFLMITKMNKLGFVSSKTAETEQSQLSSAFSSFLFHSFVLVSQETWNHSSVGATFALGKFQENEMVSRP